MTFSQILGHDRQKDILRRAVASGRLAHAYLFEGPEGIGKRLMALALVRAVFCQDGKGCGSCSACRKVDHHNHPDLHLLEADGASIKIEQIRSLQKELSYRPLEAPKKVCLIDGSLQFGCDLAGQGVVLGGDARRRGLLRPGCRDCEGEQRDECDSEMTGHSVTSRSATSHSRRSSARRR